MKKDQTSREQLERIIVKLTVQLFEAEEKHLTAEGRCKEANESAAYWYKRYTETEANAHVQGVPVEPASSGVPGSTGWETAALSELR